MKQQNEFLKTVFIAAPCEVGWDSMQGVNGSALRESDAVRFCTGCSLNVFNLSNMSAKEAEELLRSRNASGEKLCAGIYRRKDGTVMTENCPKGLRKLRDTARKTVERAAAFLATITSVSLWLPARAQTRSSDMEQGTYSQLETIRTKVEASQANRTEPVSYTRHSPARFGHSVNYYRIEQRKPLMQAVPMRPAVPLDANAFNQLVMAERNAISGKFVLAEVHYKEALKLSADQKHDPALASNIAKSYAAFLRKHQRQSEAEQLEKAYKIKSGSN